MRYYREIFFSIALVVLTFKSGAQTASDLKQIILDGAFAEVPVHSSYKLENTVNFAPATQKNDYETFKKLLSELDERDPEYRNKRLQYESVLSNLAQLPSEVSQIRKIEYYLVSPTKWWIRETANNSDKISKRVIADGSGKVIFFDDELKRITITDDIYSNLSSNLRFLPAFAGLEALANTNLSDIKFESKSNSLKIPHPSYDADIDLYIDPSSFEVLNYHVNLNGKVYQEALTKNGAFIYHLYNSSGDRMVEEIKSTKLPIDESNSDPQTGFIYEFVGGYLVDIDYKEIVIKNLSSQKIAGKKLDFILDEN